MSVSVAAGVDRADLDDGEFLQLDEFNVSGLQALKAQPPILGQPSFDESGRIPHHAKKVGNDPPLFPALLKEELDVRGGFVFVAKGDSRHQ